MVIPEEFLKSGAPMHFAKVFPEGEPQKWTIEFEGHPLFEINAPHPVVWPTNLGVRVQADENGSIFHERKAQMTATFECTETENSGALRKWVKDWINLAQKNRPKPARTDYSVRSHRRGATLIHHLEMLDVQIEFRSRRAAHDHAKRYCIQHHTITHDYPVTFIE